MHFPAAFAGALVRNGQRRGAGGCRRRLRERDADTWWRSWSGGPRLGRGRAQPVIGPETPGWFPFTLDPSRVAVDSPADVSFLSAGPASRRITVRDGHFVDDRGQRLRFIGTNATFSAAFPEKEQAPAIAARMAQLGINVVRFHHLDARDIWLPGQQALDPAKLDRLDWFIHNLKQHGIYTNLNLHVSRTYPGMEALKDARAFPTARSGHVLPAFHRPAGAVRP